MLNIELLLISALRLLVEVAGFALLGQGVLYVLAGESRERNPVYQVFRIITRPPIRIVRAITPRVVVDRHIPLVTFFIVFWLWLALAYVRRLICISQGLTC